MGWGLVSWGASCSVLAVPRLSSPANLAGPGDPLLRGAVAWPRPSWRPCVDCIWLAPTSAPSHCSKLREQQPDLEAGTKEVREALNAVKAEAEAAKAAAESEAKAAAESEAAKAAAAAPPAAGEASALSPVALSLACIGCARL
eukprot:scaffold24015_cov72-Phaeocystis_antarctica.AAC.2